MWFYRQFSRVVKAALLSSHFGALHWNCNRVGPIAAAEDHTVARFFSQCSRLCLTAVYICITLENRVLTHSINSHKSRKYKVYPA